MTLTRHQQRIEHRAVVGDFGTILLAQQGELVVDEAKVERRIVDDQLRVLDELENSSAMSRKRGLSTRNSLVMP